MKKKAQFTKKTKKEIFERDGGSCIVCGGVPHSVHHVYFGTESNYGNNRNDVDQGVCLCFTHHNEVHGCSKGEGLRQYCINYLKELGNMKFGDL